jgi:hypothetical protein
MTAPSGIEPHLDSAALLTIDVQIDTLGGGAVEIPAHRQLCPESRAHVTAAATRAQSGRLQSFPYATAAVQRNPQANRPNAGKCALRTAFRPAARLPSARVAVKLFCAATDMGQQPFDRAGRLGTSAEPDRPKIAA